MYYLCSILTICPAAVMHLQTIIFEMCYLAHDPENNNNGIIRACSDARPNFV